MIIWNGMIKINGQKDLVFYKLGALFFTCAKRFT